MKSIIPKKLRRLDIHKKVLMLVLGAGFTTFLVLGIFSYYGRNAVQRDMATMSVEFGTKSAQFSEDLLIAQLKHTLGELAEANAQFVDHEMALTRDDAEILASAMTEIMSHPENYFPKTLPDPRTDTIKNAEPYRIYAPDIRNNVTPEIQNELALASNIRDVLSELLRNYTEYNSTAFVGGEKGWYICARLVLDDKGKANFDTPIHFSYERIYEFDPRKRPWYIHAKTANAPVFSELYRTIDSDGGYQQIGASAPFYDAAGKMIGVAGLDSSNIDLYKNIDKFNFDKDSINFVLNKNGEIIFSSQAEGHFAVRAFDLRQSEEETLVSAAIKMIAGEQGVVPITVDEENYYLAFAPMTDTGWSFGMVVSENEIWAATEDTDDYFLKRVAKSQEKMQEEYNYLNDITGKVLIALLIVLILMSLNLSRRFVRPIEELSNGARKITNDIENNLDKKINIHTGDEIEELAKSFNHMTAELKNYMTNLEQETADKERIATGLDVATEIQNGMLPKDFPTREDFELLATMKPAKEVGGDFYDFYFIDKTHLAITVADVSGKGIPAALFMVISKTILNNFAQTFYTQNGLAPVVAAANDQLCANNEAMMFVTAFVGVLDLETGEFVYVNGGHNPPVIYHAEENHCDFLDVEKNFVLGPMDEIPFIEQRIFLKRGDLLFIYTDGVTEALNVAEEEYLPERLIAFMNSTDCTVDLETLLKNIRGDLADHVGEAEQSDDITMFALRFKG
ncbi:MAG: SpoIIE family protein phosphatase [Selenomonadaceae bacterium]|nr:SpoIIE family protein phosphatase [Selenomonadaceae bacterium]